MADSKDRIRAAVLKEIERCQLATQASAPALPAGIDPEMATLELHRVLIGQVAIAAERTAEFLSRNQPEGSPALAKEFSQGMAAMIEKAVAASTVPLVDRAAFLEQTQAACKAIVAAAFAPR